MPQAPAPVDAGHRAAAHDVDTVASTPAPHGSPAVRARGVWIVLLALLFTVSVGTTLLVRGPFLWHVQQPAAWQGALEAALLTGLVFLALQWRAAPVARAALLLVPVALYLRRHHVDAVLPIVLLYAEGIVLLGALVLRLLRETPGRTDAWLRATVAGVAGLSLLLWLGQAAGLGTPRAQRLLAGLVLLPLLAWRWRDLQVPGLLRAAFALERPFERVWAAALIATPLVLFARSNAVFGFDEAWYGLRPERVLVGERSVFEPLGMVSPVHYFPKLYEVLCLPLSALREHSAVQGLAIVFGAAIARLAFDLLRRLGHARTPALAGAVLVWSLPTLANTSISAKPDVFAAFCLVAMLWFGWNLLQDGRRADLAWLFACAGLAVSSKLLALSYVGVLGFACLAGLAWQRLRAPPAGDAGGRRAGIGVLVLATGVGVCVCARTFLLTGMPTVGPDVLVALWRGLGMELISPVGTLTWTRPQVWSEVPGNVFGWVVSPSDLHLRTSWPGNVWIFLPLLAWLLARRAGGAVAATPAPRWLLWVLPAAALAMFLLIRFSNRGGDGNYFMAPAVLATVAGLDLVLRRPAAATLQRPLLLALGCFVALHAMLCFVSASWGLGTRAFDLDVSRSNRDSPATVAQSLASAGLDGVAHWLHGQGGRLRVLGHGMQPHIGNRLPARFENLRDALYATGDVPADAFAQRLGCTGAVALLLPRSVPPPTGFVAIDALVAAASEFPGPAVLYEDDDWRLLATGGLLPDCADPAAQSAAGGVCGVEPNPASDSAAR
ncbi:glycosyltransferase family 39 protein [Chiayiivirga flava]|uniref:Glycosyltransferase RgtA/B/C/D-like domain-containing protein n=1 Tax=Chiayiivirga flava TaxID=659595 RepID=A0A7W8D6P9_9GAMM|nr:glycosyltransferase family 39 protein [Chiayiivirga flava]MBB5208915.1 hypothetical protein [Chiayiivirga flava]